MKVIYHGGCLDGVGAAWVFHKLYGDAPEYYPGYHGKPAPDCTGEHVFFLDFSYPRAIMEEIVKQAKSVTLIDHHVSALNALQGMPGIDMQFCSQENSGAMLAWKFIQLKGYLEPMPTILLHIEDRDLWKFDIEGTKAITAFMFSYPLTIEQMEENSRMVDSGQAVKEGKALLRQSAIDLKHIMKTTKRKIVIDGYEVFCCNCPPKHSSEIGNLLTEEGVFGATYYDTENERVFSLRSKDSLIDVSKVAIKFGGGGHRNAAGFAVPRNHALARA